MSCVKSFSAVSLPGAADTPPPPGSVAAGPRRREVWERELFGAVWERSAREKKERKKREKRQKGGRRVIKQKGREESHTLGNGVSDDRTFLGDICEESERIIVLFPPLQRYLLWHIAVLCYRKSADI